MTRRNARKGQVIVGGNTKVVRRGSFSKWPWNRPYPTVNPLVALTEAMEHLVK